MDCHELPYNLLALSREKGNILAIYSPYTLFPHSLNLSKNTLNLNAT